MGSNSESYTPDEVLRIFKEQHRLCSKLDPEAEPDAEITGEMTIREWRMANDLLPWKKLGHFLNQEFRVAIANPEWFEVLEPDREKKLRGVCELIAKKAERTPMQAKKILGQECLAAGVFDALKKNLENKGVDTSELKPSSDLNQYLSKHTSPVVEEITHAGTRLIDEIDIVRKKKGFWNAINIFDPDRYDFITGDVVTFRDLVEKIIEENSNTHIESTT